jgi:hypothetical protein
LDEEVPKSPQIDVKSKTNQKTQENSLQKTVLLTLHQIDPKVTTPSHSLPSSNEGQ